MTLIEIVQQLQSLDEDQTIYARLPWLPGSDAMVANPPDGGSTTPISELSYFLEVAIARQVLDDWRSEASHVQRCRRLIDYATNDA